ncbi:MAG: hypothetical protein WCT99_11740 [Bacteroidota bacterium]
MKPIFFFGVFLIAFSLNLFPQPNPSKGKQAVKPEITFIELGSVNCIPCKKMQPVMKAIEQNTAKRSK